MIEQVIDTEGIKQDEYFIRPTFDTDLETVKAAMDEVEEKLNKKLKTAAKDLKLEAGTGIKLEYVAHHGYHFRITLSNETALRKNAKYKTLDAVKGGVRFNTDELGVLNEEFNDAREAYKEKQKNIVDEVIRVARKKFQKKSIFLSITKLSVNSSWIPQPVQLFERPIGTVGLSSKFCRCRNLSAKSLHSTGNVCGG